MRCSNHDQSRHYTVWLANMINLTVRTSMSGQVRNDQINKPYFEATAIFLQEKVINRTDKPFILVQDVRLNKQLSIVAQTCIVSMPGIFTAMNITILCTNT